MLDRGFAALRGRTEDYAYRVPGPQDLGLVVEVSLTTLEGDRTEKGAAYARAGIPVYWIINLSNRQIEVYAGPAPSGYPPPTIYLPGQSVPLLLDGRQLGEIAVNDILPPIPAPAASQGNGA